jgi:hypothetical protein
VSTMSDTSSAIQKGQGSNAKSAPAEHGYGK